MSKKTKIWLIVATAFLLIGGILFTGVMTALDWDFKKLSTNKMVTNAYTIEETYRNISIRAITADITFVPTDGTQTTVTCREEEKLHHTVEVKDGTLVIDTLDERKWYHHIGFHFETPKITVSIPRGEYGTLTVTCTTGDVRLPQGLTFASADISATTGDIFMRASVTGAITCNTTTGDVKLNGVRCESLTATGTTGDLEMEDVIATGKIYIKYTTGDVEFENCDGGELEIKVTTGDVEGTLLTPKIFEVKATTGDVRVPQSQSGGLCKIKTTTGNIKIRTR